MFGKKNNKVKIDPYKEIMEDIALLEEELKYGQGDQKRKDELIKLIVQSRNTAAEMEKAKSDKSAKIWAAVAGGVISLVGIAIPVVNYNVMYRRDRNIEDSVQMDMNRDKNSPANILPRVK